MFFERRRRAAVADDWPGAVEAAITEPLDEYLLAGDLVLPYRSRHVVDVTVADSQAAGSGIVVDAIGEAVGVG